MFLRCLSRPLRSLLRVALVLFAATCSFPSYAQLSLTMSKSFNPSSVTVGGTATTTMTVTITNPNAFTVSGISFSDTYPAGLVPDQVGAYTCSAGSAVFNGAGWALNNVTLGAGASCSVPMLMHATITGQITNTTSQVTGTGVPPGGPAAAVLTVGPATGGPLGAPLQVPALSQAAIALLALSIAAMFWLVRRR